MPTGTCPECDADVHVDSDADKGDSVLCEECGTELEVVGLDPLELDCTRHPSALGVLGGGCSGLSYQFKYDPKPRPTDRVFQFEDIQVYVDPKSMVFLDGMTLDWKDSLIHSGFAFENPHAKKSCGCSTSFTA